jgi:hypothetical protein
MGYPVRIEDGHIEVSLRPATDTQAAAHFEHGT